MVQKDSGENMQTHFLHRQFSKYSGLTFLVPACVLIGYVIGYFLDKAFGTGFLKIVFLLLGVAAGMIELIRELNKDDAGTKCSGPVPPPARPPAPAHRLPRK